jgi:hypothetical protein
LALKTLVIEVVEVDVKNPNKSKVVGKTQFLMRDALAKASGSQGKVRLFLLNEKNKFKGTLEIS